MSGIEIEIAGMVIVVHSQNERVLSHVKERYADFLSHRRPGFALDVRLVDTWPRTPGEMQLDLDGSLLSLTVGKAQGEADLAKKEGRLTVPFASLPGSLCNFLRAIYSLLCLENRCFFLHAAGVINSGSAYVFFGPSGSGKTTVARLSEHYTVMNDDAVVVRPQAGTVLAYSTPFWGAMEYRPGVHLNVPVKGFFRLIKDPIVSIQQLTSAEAAAELAASVHVAYQEPIWSEKLLALCNQVSANAPCYAMHFLPESSFWRQINGLGGNA